MNHTQKLTKYILVVCLLLIAIFFFKDEIRSAYISHQEKSTLPHYKISTQIAREEFDAAVSESRLLPGAPGVKEVLIENGLVSEDITRQPQLQIISDDVNRLYYVASQYSSWNFDILAHDFAQPIRRGSIYNGQDESSDSFLAPFDTRWLGNDYKEGLFSGLACFSCGCSCYMDRQLQIVGDNLYMSIRGEEFAIRPEYQGLYYYRKGSSSWVRLTPQIGSFKIVDEGCTVYYSLGEGAYSMDTCALAEA